jgi:hypothetical protein
LPISEPDSVVQAGRRPTQTLRRTVKEIDAQVSIDAATLRSGAWRF